MHLHFESGLISTFLFVCLSSFFTLIASAKSRHSKIAKGYVVAHKKPNLFRRLFSQGVAFGKGRILNYLQFLLNRCFL